MVCWRGVERLAFMHLVWSEDGVIGVSILGPGPSWPTPSVPSSSQSLCPLRMARLGHRKGQAEDSSRVAGGQAEELHKGAHQLYFLWVRDLMPSPAGRLYKPFRTGSGCLPTWPT